jgi:glycosyltransferase involved in cell wall biosynthesis
VKSINFLRAYYKGFKLLGELNYEYDIVHVNTLTRTGLIAYSLNILKKTPYVITEHWTRYLINQNGFEGIIRKVITKLIVKNAKAVLPVSKELMLAMQHNKLNNNNYKVVYNVVDDCFLKNYKIEPRNKKRILNVTCFFELQKNLFGLLRVVKKISEKRNDFELILIGTGVDFDITVEYAKSLNFEKGIVNFVGLKTSEEVAYIMSNVDFVVQFSNYETAGVVVSESLMCGKPIISTKTGITTECITNANGKLVDIGDEDALYTEMNFMLDNIDVYNQNNIKNNNRNNFNADKIGEIIHNIYREALDSK